jgi:hypothetical protein
VKKGGRARRKRTFRRLVTNALDKSSDGVGQEEVERNGQLRQDLL